MTRDWLRGHAFPSSSSPLRSTRWSCCTAAIRREHWPAFPTTRPTGWRTPAARGFRRLTPAPALGAEVAPAIVPNTNAVFSATAAGPKLAPWQQRLTLGPGDLVSLGIYGQKQFTRTLVPVGPDGRIKKIWPEVKPEEHAAEVLAEL